MQSECLEEVFLWPVSQSRAASISLTAPRYTVEVESLRLAPHLCVQFWFSSVWVIHTISAVQYFFFFLVKMPLSHRLNDQHLDVCCRVATEGVKQEICCAWRDFIKMKSMWCDIWNELVYKNLSVLHFLLYYFTNRDYLNWNIVRHCINVIVLSYKGYLSYNANDACKICIA